MFDSILAIILVATSFAIALAALVSFSVFDKPMNRTGLRSIASTEKDSIVFLFENEHLLDASPEAKQIMSSSPRSGSDWTHLSGLLQPRFPRLSERIRDLAELGRMSLDSTDGSSRVDAEWHDGIARLVLVDEESDETQVRLDRHSMTAMHHELDSLRATAEHVPYLTWRETAAGDIVWANRAYLDLAEAMNPMETVQPWPPAKLFTTPSIADTAEAGAPRRTALPMPGDGKRRWFEIHQAALGEETLFTAIAADDVVHAENTLSEFVSTLTKTFAHLPIGLAIFDRSRQLALFNPALTDLTLLPAEFLCAKPSLFSFLDKLREKRMMPEPKDYKTWRQQMAELEANAVNGTYEETWSLPTGQTYRVSGRPQPDGAVAFLFEDISAEISLTRRFRTELEMGQSALDSIPDAIAVFSPAGVLAMSNSAYARLWGTDPSSSFDDINLSDATNGWHQKCNPSPVWRKLRDFIRNEGERIEWTAGISMKDGRMLALRIIPVAHGATLVVFRKARIQTKTQAGRASDTTFSSARG